MVSGCPKQNNAAERKEEEGRRKKKEKEERRKRRKKKRHAGTEGICHVRIVTNTNDEPAVVGVASGGVNRRVA